MPTTETVTVYTDGACHGNPGPGGWGAVLRANGDETQLVGGEKRTTNNRMELLAAITALEHLQTPQTVVLHTDSQYVRNGITSWIIGWKKRGWKTSSGTAVKNDDLWRRLDAAAARHTVDWRWVRGHNGDEGNELADRLATRGAIEFGGSSGPRPPRNGGSGGGRPHYRRGGRRR
ncbi:ribonuclease HI [Mycobacterium koreense]|uniref:Ribonuclease H n=1 Tax=Mycolicibacillus koreensis TaxID=1069220 RepID=A0A7I7SBF6_9MYCO|nr:ribonuclease HI [Mycolicibacillus koreensis]MCV7247734.1 ribonuclease HI [Mycolicibacillus koreensis]OSC34741.1 ribonuclease HI [Mycolicibacillus koreensis]BBY54118.1 ribonuclease H [Mycolicibacillus koreensis]